MSNQELFKRYDNELVLRLHNKKNLSDTRKMLNKFEAFLAGRSPSADLAKEFLVQYSERRPRTLYRYAQMVKSFMKWYGQPMDEFKVKRGIEFVDIIEAIRSRRSIRMFKPEPVPKRILEELLNISRLAPSGGNAQPWHFAVLGGKTLDLVKERLEEKTKTSWNGETFTNTNPDLPRTNPYPKVLARRVQTIRECIFSAMSSTSLDTLEEKNFEFNARGLRFFDAPNAIIVYSDDASPTALTSIGIITQTICLTALSYGLGTCIMGITVLWPDTYRELIRIPEGKPIVTSIAIGYPDLEATINNFPRPREPLNAFVDWHTT